MLEDAVFIALGAVLGAASRVALAHLFGEILALTSSSSPIFPDLPANAVGSLLAGAFTPLKPRANALHASLGVGVSTGLLGSLTTFASWNLHATRLLVSGDVVPAAAALVIGTLVAVASFGVGSDVHSALAPRLPPPSASSPAPPTAAVIPAAVLLALTLATCLGLFLARLSPFITHLSLSSLLAPLGALVRHSLAPMNSPSRPRGTLVANTAACAINAVIAAVVTRTDLGPRPEDVFAAVITGVAGALSTVSTWAGEVDGMRKRDDGVGRAYAYIGISVVAAQVVGVAVLGTAVWTK